MILRLLALVLIFSFSLGAGEYTQPGPYTRSGLPAYSATGPLVGYLLLDNFNGTLAAGSVNGTLSDSGHVRTVVDGANAGTLSIADGKCVLVSNSYGDPSLSYTFARTPGRLIIDKMRAYNHANFIYAGNSIRESLATVILSATFEQTLYVTGISTVIGPALTIDTDYITVYAMKTLGGMVFRKGGTQYSNLTLLYISLTNNTTGNILSYYSQSSSGPIDLCDFIRIPADLYLPVPLLSTSGAMTWPTTNGLGHAEGVAGGLGAGGANLTLLDIGTWAAGGTYVTNTPVVGAELAVNNGFDADSGWTKGSGWTISAGVGVGTNTVLNIYQAVGVANKWHQVSFDLKTCTAGAISSHFGTGGGLIPSSVNTPANSIVQTGKVQGSAPQNIGLIGVFSGANFSGTIDGLFIKPLPISSLITNVALSTTDVLAEMVINAYTLGSQVGWVQSDHPFTFLANANAAAGQTVIVLKGLTKTVPDTDNITIKHPIAGGTTYTIASVGALSGGVQTLTLDVNLVEAVSANDKVGVDWASWNGTLTYFDGAGNLKLDEIKAGVYTNRLSAATAFSADKRLIPRKIGTEYRVFYNEALVGTTSLVDAACMGGLYLGWFDTLAANRITSGVVNDTGNVTNSHGVLDKYSQDSSSLNLPKEYCPDTYWYPEVACG